MKKEVNILSLFDGMSCGQLALKKAGIKVQNYYACEIDKYAKMVTQSNFPRTFQLGDINNWKNWGFDLGSIDIIFAGFPCQAWSVAGKQKGDNDPRGALVHTLIDIWKAVKKANPNVKFLFENVKMKKEFVDYINNLFGVEPIEINSSLVSAQNRRRLYWTNIPNVTQPKDKKIILKDVITWSKSTRYPKGGEKYVESRANMTGKANTLTTGQGCGNFSSKNLIVDREKSYCLDANYYKGTNIEQYLKKRRRQIVFTNEEMSQFRKLSPLECERLQTVPDNYTDIVSDTQRYKMIGNGWTVDVISHILKGIE